MLDRHLIATCYPRADIANMVFFEDYRVTVLSERLFRIECDKNHVYTDEATQSIWFRNMPKQKYSVQREDGCVRIRTKSVTLVLKAELEDSYVVMNRKKRKLSNEGNLLGTYRTLDACIGNYYMKEPKGEIKLENGVISRTGVAVVDDKKSLILRDDGKIYARRETGCDLYIFAFGNDYRGALNALYMITGNVPKIPKYALGNWWSRYYDYTDKSYLHLLDKFDNANIPLTVATIDMDWHYSSRIAERFGYTEEEKAHPELYGSTRGWTGYSWNRELFPDYRAFLAKIKDRNLKITLNLHPADGINFYEDCYEDMAKALGVDPRSRKYIPFNITDDNFINNYFKLIHKPFERDGVHFWWIDWQQGTQSAVVGLDPLWSLNHYHYLDNAVDHEPLILSRYCGVGSHRYPLGFSGDTYMNWESLDYIPYFTATASNVGYTWWSHDIGGHFHGIKDDELYLRYVQFGVFSPINRLHCSKQETNTKEPWTYMNGTGAIAERYLRLRHKMIPYLYSASIKNHKLGLSLIEPMYYDHPESPAAYKYTNQYMFGGQLLVAPITTKSGAMGMSTVKVWIPEGRWTDIFTGDVYIGNRVVELVRPLESIPVLAKEGGVFVTSGDNNGNSLENPHTLCLDIFNGNGEYQLYEDKDGKEAVTTVINSADFFSQKTTVRVEGDADVVPCGRVYELRFRNIEKGSKIKVVSAAETTTYTYDDNDYVTIVVEGAVGNFSVVVDFPPIDAFTQAKKMAGRALVNMQGDNDKRAILYRNIMKAADEKEYRALVADAPLHAIYKKRLLELL